MNNELNEHMREEAQKKERAKVRAKFDGKALEGLLSFYGDDGDYERAAIVAAKYADALIAELDKEPNHE